MCDASMLRRWDVLPIYELLILCLSHVMHVSCAGVALVLGISVCFETAFFAIFLLTHRDTLLIFCHIFFCLYVVLQDAHQSIQSFPPLVLWTVQQLMHCIFSVEVTFSTSFSYSFLLLWLIFHQILFRTHLVHTDSAKL